MKINELRIEPHIVKPDTTKENDAPRNGFVLWKIWVNEELITNTCYPFSEVDTDIELFTNIQFPYWGDGSGYLSMRKIKSYIIWSEILDEINPLSVRSLDKFLSVFRIEEYKAVYQSALTNTLKLNSNLHQFSDRDTHKVISGDEILILIKRHFPRDADETAIYFEPHNPQDTTGKFFMRKMKNALDEITEFTTCEPPEKQIELRIGLDEDEFTEAIWHIGKVNGQFAIYFEQHPSFPVWLQSSVFDKVLSQEPFNQDV